MPAITSIDVVEPAVDRRDDRGPVAIGSRNQKTSRARFQATISTATEIMVWPDGKTSNFVFSRLLMVSLIVREIGVVVERDRVLGGLGEPRAERRE